MTDAWKEPDPRQIQGDVWPGFKKSSQGFLFVRFTQGNDTSRAWLSSFLNDITTAQEVLDFRQMNPEGLDRLKPPPAGNESRPWINVAFSFNGIKTLLGVDEDHPDVSPFPAELKDGMTDKQPLPTAHEPDPPSWPVGGTSENEADALVIIAADRPEAVETELEARIRDWQAHQLVRVAVLRGDLRPGNREHFGFIDGVTQIRLDDSVAGGGGGPWESPEKPGDRIPSGELILGPGRTRYRRTDPRYVAPTYPSWAENGSYLTFRRLKQERQAFRDEVARAAQTLTEAYDLEYTPELVAAKLVGRWPSGAKLDRSLSAPWSDPFQGGKATGEAARIEPSDFENDPDGLTCPLFAHIRKAHPRSLDSDHDRPDFHRLVRRSIPYAEPDGSDVGILFVAYQASIAEQFDHISKQWMNHTTFPTPATPVAPDSTIRFLDPGLDPIVGSGGGSRVARPVVYPGPDVGLNPPGGTSGNGAPPGGDHTETQILKTVLRFERFVTLTGGGNYFVPSIDALHKLAERSVGDSASSVGDSASPGGVSASPVVVEEEASAMSDPVLNPNEEPAEEPFIVLPYSVLAELIRLATPYDVSETGDNIGIVANPETNQFTIEKDGLAQKEEVGNPFTKSTLSEDELKECIYWYFDGKPRRVTKAIRIRYAFMSADGLKTDHLLLGYEGPSSK